MTKLEESGEQLRGRQRFRSMDGVTVALNARRMSVEAARQCGCNNVEWRALVKRLLTQCLERHLSW